MNRSRLSIEAVPKALSQWAIRHLHRRCSKSQDEATKMLIRDVLRKGLIAMGEKEVDKTSRFQVFSSKEGEGFYYYLGSKGAFRVGPNIRDSQPVSEKFRQQVMKMGE